MKSSETNAVGQAVFGYSNGHRLLTSTSTLSSVDVYELAAASDLAPGARIVGTASYLTGLFLSESKLYALVRTWLAPEMPRPGCVWSHVLLIDHACMTTQIDLGVVADLHRKPDNFATDPSFSTPLRINRRHRAVAADPRVTERVLLACYSDIAIDESNEDMIALERAIIAVWSQQWPRLRRQFAFRSISTSTDSGRLFLRMERGARPVSIASRSPWLAHAASDATSETVSPLRRFLWRYGKDIPNRRSLLPELVSIFDETRSTVLEYKTIERVLAHFPAGQADTLKYDLLGLRVGKAALVPSLKLSDLVRLMTERSDIDIDFDDQALAYAVAQADPSELSRLPSVMATFHEALGGRFDILFDAAIPMFDPSVLESDEVPVEFVIRAVSSRPELLSSAVMQRLNSDELLNLWAIELTDEQRVEIVQLVMQRPRIEGFESILLSESEGTFAIALELVGSSRLHSDWAIMLRSND